MMAKTKKVNIGPQTFIPMPVALVGALVSGKANFMTAGWLTRVNYVPPMIAVGINKDHYTPTGILEHKTFSVNFPGADLVEKTDYCGIVSGRRADKSALFEVFSGELGTAPMIRECTLSLECRLVDVKELPTNNLFIGEIVASYIDETCLSEGKPDVKKMKPLLLTMPDNNYWMIGDHAGKAWCVGRNIMKGEG
jgi:flavin reductase (DIM6/NTAB) family NADH-FMN oxidoreductase RutF